MLTFAQTHGADGPIFPAIVSWGGKMTGPRNEKHKLYAHYAAHCLHMVTAARDQDSRAIQREMAAEWLKLADDARHPLQGPRTPMK